MPTFYGPPSDGTVIPEQLETALAADIAAPGSVIRDALDAAGLGQGGAGGADLSALAQQAGRKLAAATAGRLAETAPGVTVGPMIAYSAASDTSIGAVTFTATGQAITTSVPHGFTVGERVGFTGVTGVTGITHNEDYVVRDVPTETTLTLQNADSSAALTFSGDGAATGLYRRSFAWDRKRGQLYQGMRVTEGRAVQSAATYPQFDHIKPDPTVVTYAPGVITGTGLRIVFEFTGDRIDLMPWQGGSNEGRIIVDGLEAGKWDAASFTAAGVSAWRGRLPVVFSDARRRTIEIIINSTSDVFVGFDVGKFPPPSYPLSAGPKGARWLFSGDSFTEGTGQGAGWGYVRWVAEHLGLRDVWRGGSGSTGYVQDGNRLALIDRYVNDILGQDPQGVVLAYGINDGDAWSTDPTTVTNAAATVWDAIIADTTIKELIIVGPFPNGGGTGVQQRYRDMDAEFSRMAEERGLRYISPISEGWTFTLSDTTHPDAAGHELIGQRIAGHLSI